MKRIKSPVQVSETSTSPLPLEIIDPIINENERVEKEKRISNTSLHENEKRISNISNTARHTVLELEPTAVLNIKGSVPSRGPETQVKPTKNPTIPPVEADGPGEIATTIHNSTRFLWIFLKVIGRFPSTTTTIENNVYVHKINWKGIQSIYFHIVTGIMYFVFIFGLFNVLLVSYGEDILNVKGRPGNGTHIIFKIQTRELAVLHRNFIMFVTVGANILNGVACSAFFYTNRNIFPAYMGCFARNLQIAQIDASPFILFSTMKYIGIVCIFALLMLTFAIARFGQAFIGGSTLVAVLTFRLFTPEMLLPIDEESNDFSATFYVLQTIGMILMVMSYLWSKSFVILFLSHVKILLNAAIFYNGRLYNSVVDTENPFGTRKDRTTMSLLFRDHCILLDLLDGTNDAFSGILESCYLTEGMVLPFHIYYIYRTLKFGHDHHLSNAEKNFFIRPYEFINAILLMVPSIYFFLTLTFLSGDVSGELQTGIEILRRKSLIGRTTDEELLYLLSMYSSFNSTEPIEVNGGGFAGVDKDLLIGAFGVLVFFTLLVAQYYPTFDYYTSDPKYSAATREEIGRFLEKLEGLCKNHWNQSYC